MYAAYAKKHALSKTPAWPILLETVAADAESSLSALLVSALSLSVVELPLPLSEAVPDSP